MDKNDEVTLIELGKRLKELRNERGLSQEDFATLSHLDRTYVSGLERGKRNPSFLILLKIAKVFEITLNDLIS